MNHFCLRPRPVDAAALAAYASESNRTRAASECRRRAGVDDDEWDAKLDVVRESRVEVVSTTFGCPPPTQSAGCRRAGASVWVTVGSPRRTRRDAREAEGADAIVVQGAEAGGHRASFDDADDDDRPLLELLRLVAAEVDAPLVAAGGVVDGSGIAASLEAGARAAQLGTAFLLCPEAGTHEAHRRALAAGGATAVTRAFTGRRARGIVNEFMRRTRTPRPRIRTCTT